MVDSGSDDGSCEIAREAGAEVLQFEWDGGFPKKRNWALREVSLETGWVLFLDADEFVTDAFVAELEAALPTTDCVGFWLNYERWFLGRQLRHGDEFLKLALFRVGAGEYERIEESRWSGLDMEIHEHPVLEGPTGEIAAPIEHNEYRGLAHYIAKHNEYSSWEAARWLQLESQGRDACPLPSGVRVGSPDTPAAEKVSASGEMVGGTGLFSSRLLFEKGLFGRSGGVPLCMDEGGLLLPDTPQNPRALGGE